MLAKLATFMARKRGLYRRKDSRYWWVHLLLPDGRRVCQSTRCSERAKAEAFVVRLQSEELRGPEHQTPASFAWPQAVVRYLDECAEKKSLSDDRDHLKKLEPFLRSHRLDAVNMAALQPFIRDRKEKDGVRNATINRALEIVRRILNWHWIRAVIPSAQIALPIVGDAQRYFSRPVDRIYVSEVSQEGDYSLRCA
jgi:hypothetical protein